MSKKGKKRAEHGEALLKRLSNDLTQQLGKGWGEPHFRAIRQFYLIYGDIKKRYTLCSESEEFTESKIGHTPGRELIPAKTLSARAQLLPMESFNTDFHSNFHRH